MWKFLLNLFKKKKENKEWLEGLFDNIEYIKKLKHIVSFEILEIKSIGFLVKTQGLYGYVPIKHMPWQYEKMENWEAIMSSLKACRFYGYVYKTGKSEDGKTKRVFVKADSVFLNAVTLKKEEAYTGIVIQKVEYGVFVDIGHHFQWKCGSFVGFVHQSKFPDPDSFQKCEMGHLLTVTIIEKNEKGLSFKDVRHVDLYEKYAGKTIQAKVYKNEQGELDFRVDELYMAKMPFWTTIYKQELLLVKKTIYRLPNGAVVNCDVIEIKNNTIIVKMNANNDALGETELQIQTLKAYYGKTVKAQLLKKENNSAHFLVEDKYEGIMPLQESIYKKDLMTVKKAIDNCSIGNIMDCHVKFVDIFTDIFTLKYILKSNSPDYTDKTVKVNVCRDDDALSFLVNKTQIANMPITASIYGEDLEQVQKVMDCLTDGDILNCEVLDFVDNTFTVKLLMNSDIVKKVITQPNDSTDLIGKIVKVNVTLNPQTGLDFLIENTWKAILPIKKYDYGANIDLLHQAIDYWLTAKVIDCEVLGFDRNTDLFVLKWRPKDRKWSGINWNSVVVDYLRKIVFVFVYFNDCSEPVFFVDNKYWAVLEGTKSELEKIKPHLYDGAIVQCKVNSFCKQGYFTISWVKEGISYAKTRTSKSSLEKMSYAELLKKNRSFNTETQST